MMLSPPVRDMVAAFFFAYQRISPAERLQLHQEISKVESKEMGDRVMELTNPWIEAGKEQGRQEGRQEGLQAGRQQGEVELVLRLLSRRFGALSASQEKIIRKLPLQSIEELGEALLEFTSSADLARWLRLHK
jgi:flagellar biosynthesis/type III secretory pathway protein FliH